MMPDDEEKLLDLMGGDDWQAFECDWAIVPHPAGYGVGLLFIDRSGKLHRFALSMDVACGPFLDALKFVSVTGIRRVDPLLVAEPAGNA